MADEIRLKAPTVEQQVNIVINGEEKLKAFSNTLDKISNNKNIQKYWKSQQELINATADAYSNFQKKSSNDNAAELIKVTNALKAVSGIDLSQILPDFDKISNGLESAIKVVGSIDDAFSVKSFKEAFESFETLMAYGVDIQKVFSGFGVSTDITELQGNVSALQREVDALTSRLIRARDANTALANEFENYKNGSGFADKLAELDDLKSELAGIREQALDTFYQFLKLNNISNNGYDYSDHDGDRFNEYFQRIQEGSLTASEAITNFKAEYAYLLKENFNSSSDAFGLEQLQAFSDKLDTIFHQVEETSNKINSIIENGVIAKSVQNLSEDTSLSDSQRSLFGNLLQDEESLKSVTALFQKLIDESNQTKNTEIFSTEQFEELKTLFSSIESSLSSIKGVLVDVGDGQELSPLLQKLEEIRKAASNIKLGLNMNINTGNNLEFEEELKKKQVNVLAAYQNLFYGFKQGSSAFPSPVFQQIWDFDDEEIDKYESVSEKISAYESFIKSIRQRSKDMGFIDQTTNSDFKPYWNAISGAKASLTKFKNSSNQIDNNPLSGFFGNIKELNQVVEKLGEISEKLDELSVSAKTFAESFSSGLNVTASVAEIETLTNKVKELESELAKIKTSTASTPQVETNISSDSNPAIERQNLTQEIIVDKDSIIESLQSNFGNIETNIKTELSNLLNDVSSQTYDSLTRSILEILTKSDNFVSSLGYGEDDTSELRAFIRNSKIRYDSSYKSEFGDDWNKVNATLGMTSKSGVDIITVLSEANDVLGTTFDLTVSNQEAIARLYEALSHRPELSINSLPSEIKDIVNQIVSEYISGINQVDSSLNDLLFFDDSDVSQNKTHAHLQQTQEKTAQEAKPKIKENLDAAVQSENKVIEGFQEIKQETEKAAESAKKYGKILSQTGLVGMQFNDDGEQIPSKYSYTRQTGEKQIQTVTVKYEKDEESGEINENTILGEYITGFAALEKEIDKADKKVADLKKKLAVDKIKLGDNYDTSSMDALIKDAENHAAMLYNTLKSVYDEESDYEYSISQYDAERAKKQAEYNTQLQNTLKIEQARVANADKKRAIDDSKKEQKNIKQSNRVLNRQQILIDEIEKTYSTAANKDLDKAVDNPDDLNTLANKKAEIQQLIGRLKNQGRNSSNEQAYLDLEKSIAEYKQLSKDKLRANNPSKQELNGQSLKVSLEQQVAQYNELIIKAEKFGDITSELVTKLKEQRNQIAEMNSSGIYTAKSGLTSNDYNNARDNYKIGNAEYKSYASIYTENSKGEKEINKIISALEKTEKLLNNLPLNDKLDKQFLKLMDDVDVLNQKLQDGKITLSQYKDNVNTITSEYSKAVKAQNKNDSALEKETKSSVNKALKDQVDAWKHIQSIREKIAKEDNPDNIAQLQQTKKYYQEQYLAAQKIVKAHQDICDYQAQVNKLKQIELETTTKIQLSQNDKTEKDRYDNRRKAISLSGKFNKYADGTKYTKAFTERAEKYASELKLMQFTDSQDVERLREIEGELDKIAADSKLLENKVIKQKSIISDYITQVELYAAKNNNMTATQKNTVDKIISDLKALYNSGEIVAKTFEDIQISFNDFQVAVEKSGNSGKNLISMVGDRIKGLNAQFIAQFLSWQDFIRYAQEGISVVRELNTALTEMRKVSSESVQTLKDYQVTTFSIADAVGTTAKQIQNSTADWMRLGENINEASESAKVANVLLNVSEFEGIDEATESLVSMSQAYKDLDKMDIVDVLNNIGNNYSISTDGLATALQNSASALVTANNDLNEAVALTTAGNAITQDPSSVGAGLRTISLRLVGTSSAKDELEELGEETDGVITTVSKLRETIMSATAAATADGKGFDILDSNGNYKSTYEIMQGLADLYDDIVAKDKELGTNNLNLLLETIAGEFLPEICGNTFYRTHLTALIA